LTLAAGTVCIQDRVLLRTLSQTRLCYIQDIDETSAVRTKVTFCIVQTQSLSRLDVNTAAQDIGKETCYTDQVVGKHSVEWRDYSGVRWGPSLCMESRIVS